MSDKWMIEILDDLRQRGLERVLCQRPGPGAEGCLNFATNDYLDLSRDRRLLQAAEQALHLYGAGSVSSRLVSGSRPCHEQLEHELKSFHDSEASLVFGAGYLANIGVLSVLVSRHDTVFADRLIHASLIDGIMLSRARLLRFRHNDTEHLRELLAKAHRLRRPGSRFLVVTESVFSMDGDLAPLADICCLSAEHGADVLVDEAHAVGVFGPHGEGLACDRGVASKIAFFTATLSKAFGSYGGYVCSSEEFRRLLINRSRPFIYNTALPPPAAGAALASLRLMRAAPGLGRTLVLRALEFRQALAGFGLDVMQSQSHIVPVLIKDNERAIAVARQLEKKGIIVAAIREPTVPRGTARLRFSLTLAHSEADLADAAEKVAQVCQAEGVL